MYESQQTPPLPARQFTLRLARHIAIALMLVMLSLLIGMTGYRHFESMSWLDAFLNSAMLLGGMGPVKTDGLTDAGKLFAGLYALYAGLVFIAVMGIVLTPADSTPSGHPVRSHLARHSTAIWPPVPRPSGRAVGAQRRRGGIVSPGWLASSISASVCALIHPSD